MSYIIYPMPQISNISEIRIHKPNLVSLMINNIEKERLGKTYNHLLNVWEENFSNSNSNKMVGKERCQDNACDSRITEEKLIASNDDSLSEQKLIPYYDRGITEQGYVLEIKKANWTIGFSDCYGLYYGILTFIQIWEQSEEFLYELHITDYPMVKNRGVLIDISRDKIPTKETMFGIINKLSGMRINELQLYIQGYPFEYEGYEHLFSNETPYTKKEMKEISSYAKSKFISMIPNMNCLGHMDMWLEQEELRDFSECPEGFSFKNLYHRESGTIDPYDEKAFDFITSLAKDLMECFDEVRFNANLDEPYELGMGKNKELTKLKQVPSIYVEYINKLNNYLNKQGYQMMMWGDVIFNHPELISELPKNIILLDWIYEGSASFKNHAKLVEKEGFLYYVCPGTSAWCSFLGRSDNMKGNIKDAIEAATTYHAKGIMVTDWGDMGHWQYLPISYLGYAFTGAYSWNISTKEDTVFYYLNHYVFKDTSNCFARTLYDLGNYYLKEDTILFNTTFCFANITSKYRFDSLEDYKEKMHMLATLTEHIAQENHIPYDGFQDKMNGSKVSTYINEVFSKLEAIRLNTEDGVLIHKEIKVNARMALHGAKLHYVMTNLYERDRAEAKIKFQELYDDMKDIMRLHYELWIQRNKKGGFSRSVEQMKHLCKFYRRESKIC